MIRHADIRDSLVELIKERAGLSTLKVFFNFNANAEGNYVYVRLRPMRTDLGWGDFIRTIRVDFQFHIDPDGWGDICASDYYDIIDALDTATLHSIKIADRYIVVQETSSIIFDNILTYSFQLEFSDYWHELPERDKAELMEYLHLDLNENGRHAKHHNSQGTSEKSP